MDAMLKKRFITGFLAAAAMVAVLCGFAAMLLHQANAEPAKVVLRSSLAGRWYPADAEMLRGQIEGFFQKAQVKPTDNVIAVILPHAGYQYSGQTAVAALKTTDKKYERIVIIGPSHSIPM